MVTVGEECFSLLRFRICSASLSAMFVWFHWLLRNSSQCSILFKIMLFDCVSVLLEHHLPLACVWKQMNLHYNWGERSSVCSTLWSLVQINQTPLIKLFLTRTSKHHLIANQIRFHHWASVPHLILRKLALKKKTVSLSTVFNTPPWIQ